MKTIVLSIITTALLVGCAHERGGTGSQTDMDRGSGSSDYNRNRVNDLDDMGMNGNMRPNGQARVPGRSIDIYQGQ